MTNHEPHIELRGVRVHNLQGIDLDLPLGRLIVVTGVSGAGKSSLAFDTLYAEGQRRYVESFSTYARRFLDRFERPDAERIEPIPPAVAVRQRSPGGSRRATVGTVTEIYDCLRLLFGRSGRVECPDCGRPVERHSPTTVERVLAQLETGRRFMICFPAGGRFRGGVGGPVDTPVEGGNAVPLSVAELMAAGFSRVIVGGQAISLSEARGKPPGFNAALVIVDRLAAGAGPNERQFDSLELAFRHGAGACVVLVRATGTAAAPIDALRSGSMQVDGETYDVLPFHDRRVCGGCGREFQEPDPSLFNFNSPLGACPRCRGTGEIALEGNGCGAGSGLQMQRAAAPKLITAVAQRSKAGTPARKSASLVECPECGGARLRPEALAVRLAGRTIVELTRMTAVELHGFIREWTGDGSSHDAPAAGGGARAAQAKPDPLGHERTQLTEIPDSRDGRAAAPARPGLDPLSSATLQGLLRSLAARFEYLKAAGLGYLTLDRPMRTLSAGEAQRVRLTAALGSEFVNLLYVLDEPTSGLHPRDGERLAKLIERLRDSGNTVVMVEHDAELIRRADLAVELGPGAGKEGGRIVFRGAPAELLACEQSVTADFLSRRRTVVANWPGRRPPTGWLRLAGVEHHNLHDVSIDFPLGALCVVTGVSGAGKSSLVEETLYPAVAAALRERATIAGRPSQAAARSVPREIGAFRSLTGFEQIEEVLLVDRSPIGRSGRMNPASHLNLFGEIRGLFAGTAEAKVRNFSAGHFSFNSAGGGRCETCRGAGSIAVDMQFLPDVTMSCPDCHGSRFRREILDAKYRGLSIAEVLSLTVREAFGFFRGRTRLQRRLKVLKDVGLEYLTLGQPADTLSGGEAQRLKLASFLARSSRSRTLFIIDEPTTGLHPADVSRVLECLGQFLALGHSLIVIEHHLDFIRAADYLIDLGPESGPAGGRVVASGAPEDIMSNPQSITGQYLHHT